MSMRVLHVVESLKPEAGSVAVSLPGLFPALQQRGVESQVVTRKLTDSAPQPVPHRDLKAALADRIVREAAVVHLHGWGSRVTRKLAAAAQRAQKPYVIAPLGALSEGPFHKRGWRDRLRGWLVEDRLFRGAAALTALNGAEHQVLRHHPGAAGRAEVRVLPYGLNMAEYAGAEGAQPNHAPGPEVRYLLFLGPLHPMEGVVSLMRAVGELGGEADGWNIVLAGPERGPWRKMIEATVRRKGGGGRVVFTSAPDVATQRSWLARASAVAVPSLYVRCPVSVLQAVAAGVPVIASDRVAPDGLNGAIRACAPQKDSLKQELRALFRLSDDERIAGARDALERGRSLYDWSVLADRYVELYHNIT